MEFLHIGWTFGTLSVQMTTMHFPVLVLASINNLPNLTLLVVTMILLEDSPAVLSGFTVRRNGSIL